MFSIVLLQDNISIKPDRIGYDIKSTVFKTLKNTFENKILGRTNSLLVKIIDMDEFDNGTVNEINGSILYKIKYTAVAFSPIKDQILDVIVYKISDICVWLKPKFMPTTHIIDCLCPKKFINDKFKYDEIRNEWYSKNEVIKVDSEMKLKITNFQIDTNKISIIGFLNF